MSQAVYCKQCIASSVSQAVYRKQCIASSVSQAVYRKQCIASSVSQAVHRKQCITSSASQAVYGAYVAVLLACYCSTMGTLKWDCIVLRLNIQRYLYNCRIYSNCQNIINCMEQHENLTTNYNRRDSIIFMINTKSFPRKPLGLWKHYYFQEIRPATHRDRIKLVQICYGVATILAFYFDMLRLVVISRRLK